jgi:hypothetical protein
VAQVVPQPLHIDRTLPRSTKSEDLLCIWVTPSRCSSHVAMGIAFLVHHCCLCDLSHTCTEARPDRIASTCSLAGPNQGQSVRGDGGAIEEFCEDHHDACPPQSSASGRRRRHAAGRYADRKRAGVSDAASDNGGHLSWGKRVRCLRANDRTQPLRVLTSASNHRKCRRRGGHNWGHPRWRLRRPTAISSSLAAPTHSLKVKRFKKSSRRSQSHRAIVRRFCRHWLLPTSRDLSISKPTSGMASSCPRARPRL